MTTKKPTKQQQELAAKIVEQHAVITKGEPYGYWIDLVGVIGFTHETTTDNEKKARAEAADRIAHQLAEGSIELADDWEKQNLR